METLRFLFTSSFYPPWHFGGDAVHVSHLAQELARRGHEVHVLHSLDAFRVKRRHVARSAVIGEVFTHPIETSFSLSAYAAYVLGRSRPISRRFHDLVKEVRPDVVHHHNISLLGYDILAKHGSYLNLYTAHDYWLICPQNNLLRKGSCLSCESDSCIGCSLRHSKPPQLWRYLPAFGRAVEDIDVMIAPSNYLRDKLASRISINSVNIPNFVPDPPIGIQSSEAPDFVLYAGTLEEHKGIVPLIRAFKEIANESKLRLVVVGDGTLRQRIKELVGRLGLTRSVFLMGWVDRANLYSLLKGADMLVVPSICPENSPLVALEALSMSVPVVGSNRGGIPEIVSRLDNNLIFSWELERDLERAIDYSHENGGRLRKEAQSVHQEYFSAQAYLTSYDKLLSTWQEKAIAKEGQQIRASQRLFSGTNVS